MSKAIKRVIHVFLILFLAVNILPFGEQQTYALVDPDVEKAEIDVVYKYIDLHDPTLKRGNDLVDKYVPKNSTANRAISKDYDNNELMYSLRSVLKNIPWVRKIFIIMPNDRVRFLKAPEEIKDRIVFINNEKFLGLDSDSSIVYKWNFWRLKNYGCSNHIIYLCDDYLIGQPMNKSDFFGKNKKGEIVPYIFYNYPIKYTSRNEMHSILNALDRRTTASDGHRQNGLLYRCQNARAYDFLYSVLKKNYLYVPKRVSCTIHNAMGFNLNEIKELYDIINSKYKYADYCLRGLKRSKYDMWMVALYPFYFLNKENRKINHDITHRYFDMGAKNINNNYHLFCINTGGNREYSYIERLKAKIKMEQFFPEPTKYERKDYNDWAGVDPALKERLKNEMLTQKVVNYRPRHIFKLRKVG